MPLNQSGINIYAIHNMYRCKNIKNKIVMKRSSRYLRILATLAGLNID